VFIRVPKEKPALHSLKTVPEPPSKKLKRGKMSVE
jgi:hypothetical protein